MLLSAGLQFAEKDAKIEFAEKNVFSQVKQVQKPATRL